MIYRKLKELSLFDFILTFKENLYEIEWDNFQSHPFYSTRNNCYREYNEEINNLKNIKQANYKNHVESINKTYQELINRFENELSDDDKNKIAYLESILKQLDNWNPDDRNLSKLKEYIERKIHDEIGLIPTDVEFNCSYRYAKVMAKITEEEFKLSEIKRCEENILRWEREISFTKEFEERKDKIRVQLIDSLLSHGIRRSI